MRVWIHSSSCSRGTTTFKFDPNSNLFEQDYPNSTIAALTYNAADQLTGITDSLSGVNFLNFSYGRDNVGQLASDTPKSYGYDTINRLKTYTNSGTTTYGYDNADRLTSTAISGGGNTSTLAYDNGDQLQSLTITNGVTQISKTTYAFDGKGNRTSAALQGGATTTLAYDQANRLICYGSSASYVYDGDGLRVSKTVSGTSEVFTWDLAEGLPLMVQDGSTGYLTGPGGLPLEQISGATANYFHKDQLGSTRAMTDSAGVVQKSYDYDPDGNAGATSGTLTNPLQYGGQFLDAEAGLYYLRARFYDPTVGQFLSRDLLAASTRASYVYAMDNPESFIDYTGLRGLSSQNFNPCTSDACIQYNYDSQMAAGDWLGNASTVLGGLAFTCAISGIGDAVGCSEGAGAASDVLGLGAFVCHAGALNYARSPAQKQRVYGNLAFDSVGLLSAGNPWGLCGCWCGRN